MPSDTLEAFKPQPIVELRKQDKSKIEAILAYGDRLLVGLSSGDLRIYRINDEPPDRPVRPNEVSDDDLNTAVNSVELRREVERFSRRPVQQLAVIKEANVLVSLSDGYVSFYDLQTFDLSERLEITKGATNFAVISNVVKDESTDMMTIESHLAIAVKRKILLWSWQDMELTGAPSELTLAAPVKSLAWMTRTKIVAGMDPGYVLIDIDSQESKDIYRPAATGEATTEHGTRFGAVGSSSMGYMGMGSWAPRPMASKLSDDQMLLAKDVNTLFIDTQGNTLDKRQVPWAAAPEAVGYSYPYILCLQPKHNGTLEVRNPDTMFLLQSIRLAGINNLHVPQPNISLAHAGKGFLVASDRCIWRMNAVGYDPQVKALVSRHLFDEAISLIDLLEDTLIDDKLDRLRSVKVQKARYLFQEQKYRQAMDLFSEASAVPQEVISLYPESIAGFTSAISKENTHQVPKSQGRETTPKSAPKKGKGHFRSMSNASKLNEGDTPSAKSAANLGSDSDDPTHQGQLASKDLNRAVQELLSFLAQARVQLQKYINFDGTLKIDASVPEHSTLSSPPPFAHLVPNSNIQDSADWQQRLIDTATVVDTTLFRAYMFARPGLAGALFRLDNFCDPSVVEEKLYESKRYLDLIDFLHGKKLHQQALELLEELGKYDGEGIEEVLRSPQRTVAYLQQLPYEQVEIILQFSRWPLETDKSLGMQIFLADTANAESLPRERVLRFLESFGRQLPVAYLEHIIHEWHDDTSTFHDRLIDLYLEEFKSRRGGQASLSIENLQARLELFLKKSTYYNKRRILEKLNNEDSTFWEAQAIVHGKLHQHVQALKLYVFALGSPAKAEAYCNSVYSASQPATLNLGPTTDRPDPGVERDIYTLLLSLYLAPPSAYSTDIDSALDLLSRHGSRIPALTSLDFLPKELSVQSLESYFRGRMRAANTSVRDQAMIHSLCATARSNTAIQLHVGEEHDEKGRQFGGSHIKRGQSRRVQLTEERMCAYCYKRFGRAAVRIWPNNEVRHYGCKEVDVSK